MVRPTHRESIPYNHKVLSERYECHIILMLIQRVMGMPKHMACIKHCH